MDRYARIAKEEREKLEKKLAKQRRREYILLWITLGATAIFGCFGVGILIWRSFNS